MNIVAIKGLKLHAFHGVASQENRVGNDFEVDVELDIDMPELWSDDLCNTINYAEVVDIIKHDMASPCKLIETVCLRIKNALQKKYSHRLIGGRIKIAKLAPPISAQLDSVSFTTEWGSFC